MFAGVLAVLFDLDGTLVDSRYDWPEVRARLDTGAEPILDHLARLRGEEGERKHRILEAIERQASERAQPVLGARELVASLRALGLRTAVVTNNTRANATALLARFGLELDLLRSRCDGTWKPSPRPLLEALDRLGVPPARALAVGDSRYDVLAARAAGCRGTVLVGAGAPDLPVDLRVPRLELLLNEVEGLGASSP